MVNSIFLISFGYFLTFKLYIYDFLLLLRNKGKNNISKQNLIKSKCRNYELYLTYDYLILNFHL